MSGYIAEIRLMYQRWQGPMLQAIGTGLDKLSIYMKHRFQIFKALKVKPKQRSWSVQLP